MANTKITYLACPYTHPDPKIRERRFQAATDAAASLIERGLIVFSPITMTHPIDVVLARDRQTMGSDFWLQFDQAFMDRCDEMVILEIDGWEQSEGIQREIEYFIRSGKKVFLMRPNDQVREFQR